MRMTTRSRVGQELNDSFDETHCPDKKQGLADDKAYMRSLRTKSASDISLQQIRKLNTVALTGIEVREKIETTLASLYRKKAEATKYFEEELLIRIVEDIELVERLMEVE